MNPIAVLVAAISTFIIGGLWYGALFYKLWMKENNFNESDLKKRNQLGVFGVSFIFALISAAVLEMFIGKDAEIGFAVAASTSVGIAWIATSFGTVYLFEMKSLKLFFINAGYHIVSYTIMGVILGIF